MNNYSEKRYYEILGLKPDATPAQIKKAFRLATIKFHPDVNKDGAKIFIEIKEAYEVLSNPEERKKFDFVNGYDLLKQKTTQKNTKQTQNSQSDENKPNSSYKENTQTYYQTYRKHEKTNNKESSEFSSNFSDLMKNLFNSKRNNNRQKKSKPIDGSDITMNLNISFKESLNGTNRKINVLHTEICPVCKGKTFANGTKCKYCNGSGEISLHKKINIKIPSHTENNRKIRLKGEGTKGIDGGKNGNLYLIIKITDDSYFKFEGNNVYCEIEITPYEAALGTEKEVQTLSGKVKMKIPAGTSSGQKFCLAKEGLFDEEKKIKGDQIIAVKIKINENLSEKEKKLYEELKNIAEGK